MTAASAAAPTRRSATPFAPAYDITEGMILDRANAHHVPADKSVYRFNKRDIVALVREMIACAVGAPFPAPAAPPWYLTDLLKLAKRNRSPAPTTVQADTSRLNHLAEAGGYLRGQAGGKPAFRILGNDTWHADLRAAIDEDIVAKQRRAREDD